MLDHCCRNSYAGTVFYEHHFYSRLQSRATKPTICVFLQASLAGKNLISSLPRGLFAILCTTSICCVTFHENELGPFSQRYVWQWEHPQCHRFQLNVVFPAGFWVHFFFFSFCTVHWLYISLLIVSWLRSIRGVFVLVILSHPSEFTKHSKCYFKRPAYVSNNCY